MPHVIVKLASGRTEEQKQALADKILNAVTSTINPNEDAVSITIEECEQADWKEKVYEPIIMNGSGTLYKKPGYTM